MFKLHLLVYVGIYLEMKRSIESKLPCFLTSAVGMSYLYNVYFTCMVNCLYGLLIIHRLLTATYIKSLISLFSVANLKKEMHKVWTNTPTSTKTQKQKHRQKQKQKQKQRHQHSHKQ